MLHRTEGIVLKTFPFGEADLIVSYLTPDCGLLKVFAKSPRKIKSRFGSSLEPFTHARIAFWGREDATLPRLTQSDILYSFQSLRNDLNYFLKASEIVELTSHFTSERNTSKHEYSLLLYALHDIENNINKNMSIVLYKIKFLKLIGYAPKLDVCGRCGKDGFNFYVSYGSILCDVCARVAESPTKLLPGVVKLYTDLLTWNITKIKRIRPSETLLSGLSDVIDMHIHYLLTKPLKSKGTLNNNYSQMMVTNRA